MSVVSKYEARDQRRLLNGTGFLPSVRIRYKYNNSILFNNKLNPSPRKLFQCLQSCNVTYAHPKAANA